LDLFETSVEYIIRPFELFHEITSFLLSQNLHSDIFRRRNDVRQWDRVIETHEPCTATHRKVVTHIEFLVLLNVPDDMSFSVSIEIGIPAAGEEEQVSPLWVV
jgi:hypothetical protein